MRDDSETETIPKPGRGGLLNEKSLAKDTIPLVEPDYSLSRERCSPLQSFYARKLQSLKGSITKNKKLLKKGSSPAPFVAVRRSNVIKPVKMGFQTKRPTIQDSIKALKIIKQKSMVARGSEVDDTI